MARYVFPATNSRSDETFVDFYKETCELISRLLHTGNETLILGGEGILGLEADLSTSLDGTGRSGTGAG